MNSVIACDDRNLSIKIADGLRRLGTEWSAPHIHSVESCTGAITSDPGQKPVVVFFGCRQFADPELAQIKQLCDVGKHIKVVAIGSAQTPRTVLEAVRNGAADFLDIDNGFDAELRSLVARLKDVPADRSTPGRLITVFGAAGGSGASTIAVNLAAALAKQGSTSLLDFQMGGGDLAMLLKCQPRYTLLSLAGKAHQLDRAMFDQSLIKHECGIHLLASPQLFSDYRQINPQIVQQVVQFALASYQRVVVELEDLEHSEQVRTLTASHWIVLPLRLDFVALSRTKKCIDHLLNLKVAPERIVVVASRAGRQKEMPIDTCAEVLGLPIDHRIPEDPASVNMAVNLGLPVIDLCPKSAIAANIVKLAGSISGGAKEESKPDRGKWPIPASVAAGFVGLISSCVNAAFTSD